MTLNTQTFHSRLEGGEAKKRAILEDLRASIVRGELPPGAQLPTRRELMVRYSVSLETVQRALDQLTHDEFVSATRRRGTFVVDRPPHLSRYALVFRHHPERDAHLWTRFYSALWKEAGRLGRTGDCSFETFLGVSEGQPSLTLLEREIEAQRLAGVIFADGIYGMEQTSIIRRDDVPRVSVGRVEASNCVAFELDEQELLRRAIGFFAGRGRKQLAVVSHYHPDWTRHMGIEAMAAAEGMELLPFHVVTCVLEQTGAASALTKLLWNGRVRPDALLVTDDNLVEPVTSALEEMGVRVGEELDVVGHANFPYPTKARVPTRRLGYDVTAMLGCALDSINARRAGQPFEPSHRFHAVWEDELRPIPAAPAPRIGGAGLAVFPGAAFGGLAPTAR